MHPKMWKSVLMKDSSEQFLQKVVLIKSPHSNASENVEECVYER